MEIRCLTDKTDRAAAFALALEVFMAYVAPDYAPEGVETFRSFVSGDKAADALAVYGAYLEGELAGMIATRSGGAHIALFFVGRRFQRRGVGRALFEQVASVCPEDTLTVHSSPYAKTIYERLGFTDICGEQCQDGIRYYPMKFRKL